MKQTKLTMATAKRGHDTSTSPPRSHTEKRPDLKVTPNKGTQESNGSVQMSRHLFPHDGNDGAAHADDVIYI